MVTFQAYTVPMPFHGECTEALAKGLKHLTQTI